MKKNNLPKLTPPEFEIMNIIWNTDKSGIREIHEEINRTKTSDFARSTIQVQIQRLEEKGWLKHKKERNKYRFYPTRRKEETSAEILEDVKYRVFGGSCTELVRTLFNNGRISKDEIEDLKSLVSGYSKGEEK